MKHRVWLFALTTLSGLALAAATPNVKTGGWEIAVTTTLNVSPSEAVLAALEPEQRARIEAALKARSGKAVTRLFKRCVTAERVRAGMIDELLQKADSRPGCATEVIKSTTAELHVQQVCTGERASSSELKLTAASTTQVFLSFDSSAGTSSVHAEGKGNWKNESCEGFDD
jgi:hypothetical protein